MQYRLDRRVGHVIVQPVSQPPAAHYVPVYQRARVVAATGVHHAHIQPGVDRQLFVDCDLHARRLGYVGRDLHGRVQHVELLCRAQKYLVGFKLIGVKQRREQSVVCSIAYHAHMFFLPSPLSLKRERSLFIFLSH